MPYIHFINVDSSIIEYFSSTKIDEFSSISGATIENIYVIDDGSKMINKPMIPYIKIEWMPREKDVEENVVKFFNDFLRPYGFKKSTIYFENILREHYYSVQLWLFSILFYVQQ